MKTALRAAASAQPNLEEQVMVAKKKKTGNKKLIKKPVKAKKPQKKVTKKITKKLSPKKITKKSKSVKNLKAKKTAKKSAKKIIYAKPKKINRTIVGKNKKVMTVRISSEIKPVTKTMQASKKPTTLLGALEFTPYQIKDNEIYMNDHQKDHFRKILDAWKQQLMQDVDLTVGHLKEEAVFYADPVDRASQEEGFNLELRTRDRERRLIKKIEQSLDLINTGEYGFCEDCGAEIGVRRMEARPTAVKCIDCKTFQEIREKQLGG